MTSHYAVTATHLQEMPAKLRALIGKYFAEPRWRHTCYFYNRMSERYRRTICFHAGLGNSDTVYQLEEMDETTRERVISALDELRQAFNHPPRLSTPVLGFIHRLSISERRTLFFHAGLSATEFNQPIQRIEDQSCTWSTSLLVALDELKTLFDDTPAILTSVKPENYTR
ncbi:replication protein B [Brenneria uluponensis]|uniref:replication protein B n=1 Tax=Brenneria uluponensis TaxID=3057057 RepID=UPI0028EDC8C4|nr:replication protein B [Brenneria ulupoensis]